MPRLSDEQLREFLTGGRNMMRLATLTAEGWPYVAPVWYHYEDGAFYVRGGARLSGWRISGGMAGFRSA